ncbi:hypothetical protein D3C84_858540 [compost metagenome]
MALGWPVSEKGPAPGRLFFALPAVDWFNPMHHKDRKLGDVPTHSAHCCSCSTLIPHNCATMVGV